MNARYLSIGAIVYAIVSGLWLAIAVGVGTVSNGLLIGTALVLLVLLVGAAILTIRQSTPVETDPNESAELGKWFGIIFAAEGIAIGVGSGILAALGLVEWIVPWVALIVALHFFPLGYILGLPYDYVLGGAILLLVIGSVLVVPTVHWPDVIAWGTAALLYLAGWARLGTARSTLVSG